MRRSLRSVAPLALFLACTAPTGPTTHQTKLLLAGPRLASVHAPVELELRAVAVTTSGFSTDQSNQPLTDAALLSQTNCTVRVTQNGERAKVHVEPLQPGPCLFVLSAQVGGRFVRTDASVDFLDVDALQIGTTPDGCELDPQAPDSYGARWVQLEGAAFCSVRENVTELVRGDRHEELNENLLGQLDSAHAVTCSALSCRIRSADGSIVAKMDLPPAEQLHGISIRRGAPDRIDVLSFDQDFLTIQSYSLRDERLVIDRPIVLSTDTWGRREVWQATVWRDRLLVRAGTLPMQVFSLPGGELAFEPPLDFVLAQGAQQLVIGDPMTKRGQLFVSEDEMRKGSGMDLAQWRASSPGVDLLADVVTHEDDGLTPWYVRLWDTSKPVQTLVAIGALPTAFEPRPHPRGVFVVLDGKRVFLERMRRTP